MKMLKKKKGIDLIKLGSFDINTNFGINDVSIWINSGVSLEILIAHVPQFWPSTDRVTYARDNTKNIRYSVAQEKTSYFKINYVLEKTLIFIFFYWWIIGEL